MNPVERQLFETIRQSGPIPFSRFMAVVLYASEIGYYERQGEIGKKGDFYTSVSVGEVFGQLLAFHLAPDLESLNGPVQIIEAGAHRGQLAGDILKWLQESRPELFARLEYGIIEPSPTHQTWQRESLQPFESKLRWFHSIDELIPAKINGVILSNELLDAMPVHRLRWNRSANSWDEWFVTIGDHQEFTWTVAPISSEVGTSAPVIPPELAVVFPDGFTVDVSPAAVDWWQKAAKALNRGSLMTIDYGLESEQFLDPSRSQGTLRAYSQHQLKPDVLTSPGECDITAHIDFTALRNTGEAAGLTTSHSQSQSSFLASVFQKTLLNQSGFTSWTPARIRQFQTLVHPEHLGRTFRVLKQVR